jgi:hypothetical protein
MLLKHNAQQAGSSNVGQRLYLNSGFHPRRGWPISFDKIMKKPTALFPIAIICIFSLLSCKKNKAYEAAWHKSWFDQSWTQDAKFFEEFELLAGDSYEVNIPSDKPLFVGCVSSEPKVITTTSDAPSIKFTKEGDSISPRCPVVVSPTDGNIHVIIGNSSKYDTRIMVWTAPESSKIWPKIQPTQISVEQAGTVQPATRPESKTEDSDKPQPVSEGRSR